MNVRVCVVRRQLSLSVLALALLPALLQAAPIDLYVSPTGSDAGSGSSVAPFATLERAQAAIRELKRMPGLPAGGVCVWLRGGTYARTSTFELTAEDAGTPAAPVVWHGMTGENVRVTGAVRLAPSWFSPVTDASPVWSRLDPAARGHVLQADLASHGITNYGKLSIRGFGRGGMAALELFFTNAPMPLARYPDPDVHDPDQTPTNAAIVVFGDPNPLNVTGRYMADGMSDGVNRFRRDGLAGGRQYYLYRRYWEYQGIWHRAWFLSTNDKNGYPANTDPWWSRYSETLGRMNPSTQSGSQGTISLGDPRRISHGFLAVNTVAGTNAFTYAGDHPVRWAQAEEPWLHGFWQYHWADQHMAAVNIDTGNRTITLGAVPTFGIQAGQPYYALNLLEEITRPGEWYLNRRDGRLYFWPPAPLAGASIDISMIEAPLWRLKNTSNIVVRNILLDAGRADLVIIEGGTRCAFIACTLRNAGSYAARVSGTDNGISSCVISLPGAGGVALSGGDRASLAPCRNFVRNCDIRGFGRWAWTYQPAVLIEPGSVGCLVSHNVMRDAPHTAVLFGRCNDCIIEFNDIGDVCRWSSDAGAVYIGRDWAARGNEVRWNFIHEVGSVFEGCGTQGVYLDDCQSGVRVFGNVLYRISHMAIQMGGGRDNIMENNVIARCGVGLGADGRGMGWMLARGGSRPLWQDLQRLPYRGAVWSNAYPLCAAIPSDWNAVLKNGWLRPQNNVFSRNIGFANGTWTNQSDAAFADFREMADNPAGVDPRFENEAALNLALRPDSPAHAIPGFRPIPFAAIGREGNKTLDIRVEGRGAVSRAPEQPDYFPMQFVTLTAVPAAGWRFAGWRNAASGTEPAATLCLTSNLACTARFEREK